MSLFGRRRALRHFITPPAGDHMDIDEATARQNEQLRRLRTLADDVRARVARDIGYVPTEFELLERLGRDEQ